MATMLSTSSWWSSPSSGLRTGGVGLVGVEQDQPVADGGGEPVEDAEDEVTVRGDDDGSAAGVDVLDAPQSTPRTQRELQSPHHTMLAADSLL